MHKFCAMAEDVSSDSIRSSRTRGGSRDSRTGELYYTCTRSTEENPNFADKGQIRLRREDVLHIPGLGFDGLVGYSPIAMAKNAIGIALATEEYGAAFFKMVRVREAYSNIRGCSKTRQSCERVGTPSTVVR